MQGKGYSPLLPEVVQAQGGGLPIALLPNRGNHQYNGGDQEGERLVQLSGDSSQPAKPLRKSAKMTRATGIQP